MCTNSHRQEHSYYCIYAVVPPTAILNSTTATTAVHLITLLGNTEFDAYYKAAC